MHVWQREGNIVLHPWNDFACSLDHDRPAEPVRLDLDDGSSIFGTRHHLLVCRTLAIVLSSISYRPVTGSSAASSL